MGQISLQIPQVNLPDATEDPKIASNFTTIQNAINGALDSSNFGANPGIALTDQGTAASIPAPGNLGALYYATDTTQVSVDTGAAWLALRLVPASSSISATIAAGQLLGMSGATTTATLPASPPVGTLCGVRAGTAIGSGSPVTVSAGSAIIALPGNTSGVSSFVLGYPGSYCVLLWDGSFWRTVAGGQDTGWVALGLSSNVNSFDGSPYTASYRVLGDRTYLKGSLAILGSFSASAVLATFASIAAPSAVIRLPSVGVDGSGNAAGALSAGNGNNIRTLFGLSLGPVFSLNGISWSAS